MSSAVLFDCDGVLTDNELVSCSAALAALSGSGISTNLSEVQTLIGKSNRELLQYYQERYRVVLDLAKLDGAIEQHYFRLGSNLQPMPGVATVLQRLAKAGVALAVASSGSPAKIEFTLDKIGLRGYFSLICSAQEVARGKPEPDLFLHAAQRLGQKPGDCLVVEDSCFGIQAARRAGMKALGLVGSFSQKDLEQAGANRVITGFGEFPEDLASLV